MPNGLPVRMKVISSFLQYNFRDEILIQWIGSSFRFKFKCRERESFHQNFKTGNLISNWAICTHFRHLKSANSLLPCLKKYFLKLGVYDNTYYKQENTNCVENTVYI